MRLLRESSWSRPMRRAQLAVRDGWSLQPVSTTRGGGEAHVSPHCAGGKGVGELGHRSEDDGEGSNPGAHFDISGRNKKTCNGGTASMRGSTSHNTASHGFLSATPKIQPCSFLFNIEFMQPQPYPPSIFLLMKHVFSHGWLLISTPYRSLPLLPSLFPLSAFLLPL